MSSKEYSNGEVTIVWKPKTCIHAGECVRGLPSVFNAKAKPWINAEGASTQEIVDQVKKCPSGALSSYMNADGPPQEDAPAAAVEVQVMPNGPLFVFGSLSITDGEGNKHEKTKRTSFCRCGHSQNKPFCDGSHKQAGFEG